MSIFTSLEGVSRYSRSPGCDMSRGGESSRGAGSFLTTPTSAQGNSAGGGGDSSPETAEQRREKKARSRTNCLLMSAVFASVGVLVICGVVVVREYAVSLQYGPAVCKVLRVTYLDTAVPCMHCSSKEKGKAERGAGACSKSKFPCANLEISYTPLALINMTSPWIGQLHTDSLQAKGNYRQCSYAVCLKSEADNNATVEAYLSKWRAMSPEDTFRCYYDMRDSKKLIERKHHTKNQVIHSMLWPSLVILLCGLVFLRLELKRRKIDCFGCCRVSRQTTGKTNLHPSAADDLLGQPATLKRIPSGAETPV